MLFYFAVNQKPAFKVKCSSVTKSKHDHLYLSCSAQGRPAPKITWFAGDQPLTNGDDILVFSTSEINETESHLIIPKVAAKHQHAGYSIKAQNIAGDVEHKFAINGKILSTRLFFCFYVI